MVGDREGAQVHDASEAERGWSFSRQGWHVLGEDHLGGADDAILALPGVVWMRTGKIENI